MKCIAIDDEPIALSIIEKLCSQVPGLELAGTFVNPIEAMDVLQKESIDLIFLDIRMPDMTGFQFLNSLTHKPLVILTTAYSQYGAESYEFDVVDYLLKPIALDRFVKAVNKAKQQLEIKYKTLGELNVQDNYIFVNSEYKLIKINIAEILFIEGLKDYIKIQLTTSEKPILTIMRIKTFEENLPSSDFIRVHRSFIVNIHKIDYIKKNRITIGKHEIPVGENYAESFFKLIEGRNWK
ncbi:MAG TPA: LytTR family DNA-binding domain-containing protein [Cytophagaceae bacterium]